jgi:hypothetical protein
MRMEDRVYLAVAQLQHDVVVCCRKRMDELGLNVRQLAEHLASDTPSVGTKPDMLRRKFRGESRASCADLAAWLDILSVDDHPLVGGSSGDSGFRLGVTPIPYDECNSDSAKAPACKVYAMDRGRMNR